MNKKRGILLMMLFGTLCLSGTAMGKDAEKEITANGTFAIVTKSSGNAYNDLMAEGFRTVIENAGGTCLVRAAQKAVPEGQEVILQSILAEGADVIAVSAVDADALTDVLDAAAEEGIKVISFDSALNPEQRILHVSDVDEQILARTLMDAVSALLEGEGQWAVLSTSENATNQKRWLEAMQSIMGEEAYEKMELIEVIYGGDDEEESTKKMVKLLEDYPKLKGICSLTTIGSHIACQVVETMERNTQVRVTGLGLPSEIFNYIGEGSAYSSDYMYLWNPYDVGMLTAYTAIRLQNGDLEGIAGEEIQAGEMGFYPVIDAADGGTEVVTGPPLKFDASNIKEWVSMF